MICTSCTLHIRVEAKRAALEVLSGRKPEGNGTDDQSVPVYSDPSPMKGSEGGEKKLEVATVP